MRLRTGGGEVIFEVGSNSTPDSRADLRFMSSAGSQELLKLQGSTGNVFMKSDGVLLTNDIRPTFGKVLSLVVRKPGNAEGVQLPGYNQQGFIFGSGPTNDSTNFGYNIGYCNATNLVYNTSVNTTARNGYFFSAQYGNASVWRIPNTNAIPTGGSLDLLFSFGNTSIGGGGSNISYLDLDMNSNTIQNVADPVNPQDGATKA